MTSKAQNNKRIAKNTFMLYVRMAVLMVVSIYMSRVVLKALGEENYGIYNVVAGVVTMFGFFSSSLVNVTQRFLNLELGTKNSKGANNIFNMSILMFFVISLVAVLIAAVFGRYLVYEVLTIPYEKLSVALNCYYISLVSLFLSINLITFQSTVVANEKMSFFAYMGLVDASLKLLITFLVLRFATDSLIVYCSLLVLVPVFNITLYAIFTRKKIENTKLYYFWDTSLAKKMGVFVSHNLFGCFAFAANSQGINILINIFFGPIANAAQAIASQVSNSINMFVEGINTAFKPQIIQSCAAGDKDYTRALIYNSSRYNSFIASIISIPLLINTEYILQLWLVEVPENTLLFVRLALINSMIYVFVPPLWNGANATGNIKKMQVYGRMITLLVLPVTYILLKLSVQPFIPYACKIGGQVFYLLYCLVDMNKQLDISYSHYFRKVIIPFMFLYAVVFIFVLYLSKFASGTFIGFVCSVLCSTIVYLIVVYFFGINKEERTLVNRMIRKYIK